MCENCRLKVSNTSIFFDLKYSLENGFWILYSFQIEWAPILTMEIIGEVELLMWECTATNEMTTCQYAVPCWMCHSQVHFIQFFKIHEKWSIKCLHTKISFFCKKGRVIKKKIIHFESVEGAIYSIPCVNTKLKSINWKEDTKYTLVLILYIYIQPHTHKKWVTIHLIPKYIETWLWFSIKCILYMHVYVCGFCIFRANSNKIIIIIKSKTSKRFCFRWQTYCIHFLIQSTWLWYWKKFFGGYEINL